MRIYLAGCVDEVEYRKDFKYLYRNSEKLIRCDPMELDKTDLSKIVDNDKALMRTCDVLVAYVQKITVGTMLEIGYAYDVLGIPIYVINPNGNYRNDIWLKHYATKMFSSILGCITYLEDL